MKLTPVTLGYTGWDGDGVRHVLHHMRPADAEEAFALLPDSDPDGIFMRLMLQKDAAPWCEVVWKPDLLGAPVAFAIVTLVTPGVGQAWMLATPGMGLRDFALWGMRLDEQLGPACIAAGLHRVQASCLAGNRAAQRLLRQLGMKREGPERGLGKGGEDFERWAALKDDWIETKQRRASTCA